MTFLHSNLYLSCARSALMLIIPRSYFTTCLEWPTPDCMSINNHFPTFLNASIVSHLSTCPNHLNLCFCIHFMIAYLNSSDETLSFNDTLHIHLIIISFFSSHSLCLSSVSNNTLDICLMKTFNKKREKPLVVNKDKFLKLPSALYSVFNI